MNGASLRAVGVLPERQPLRARSFARLRELPPEPQWVWSGLLARGSLTMLAGRPFAGKSWLVAGLLSSIDAGQPFLGLATQAGSALVVTEEDDTVVRDRAERLGLFDLRSEVIARSDGIFKRPWQELIEESTEIALKAGHQMLVIDTFPGLACLQAEEENDAGAISSHLRPLQRAAAEELAVLFLHHVNGQGQARGSSAFRGVVDVSIGLQRNGDANSFTLRAESRFATTPRTVEARLIETEEGSWYEALDRTVSSARRSENTTQRLLQALDDAGDKGLTYAEIGRLPGLSEDIAKKRLPDLHERGIIGREQSGRKGTPYRWHARAE